MVVSSTMYEILNFDIKLNIHLANEHRMNSKNLNLHTANNESGRMLSVRYS